ncbi:MAG TPA: hypothetical protein VH186_26885 [Chloroflexia bacterium]|nr:hypothetical protein [Chloroflexia bacterium]
MTSASTKKVSLMALLGLFAIALALLVPAYAVIFWGIGFASICVATLMAAEQPDPAHATRRLVLSVSLLFVVVLVMSLAAFTGVVSI